MIVMYNHGRILSYLPVLKDCLQAVLQGTDDPKLPVNRTGDSSSDAFAFNNSVISDKNITSADKDIPSQTALLLDELCSSVEKLLANTVLGHDALLKILEITYSLRYEKNLRSILTTNLRCQEALSRSLTIQIAFLGRVKATYLTFISVIRTFMDFSRIKVIPNQLVKPPRKIIQPPQGRLSLEHTFGLFRMPLKPSTLKQIIGRDLTIEQAYDNFFKFQSVYMPTHAEIQMIVLLMRNDITLGSMFPYIGCSKLSCYLCFAFVHSCGHFKMRGSHQRIFPKWCLPRLVGLQDKDVSLLRQGIKSLRNEVTRQILSPVAKTAKLKATTIADVTSIGSAEDDLFRMQTLARILPLRRSEHWRAQEHQHLRNMSAK